MENIPSLQEVRNELVATLYCLAHTLDIQTRDGAGAAMLGLPSDTILGHWPDFADFDYSFLLSARSLETVYRYAFYGELDGWIGSDIEEGNLGRIQALLDLSKEYVVTRNLEDLAEFHDMTTCCGLGQMVRLASARERLDDGYHISLADIALLAEVTESTVRNALHAQGPSRLVAFRDEFGEQIVDRQEALRWLRIRPNFRETVWTGASAEMPDDLTVDEIMPFLKKRFHEKCSEPMPINLMELLKPNPVYEINPYRFAALRLGYGFTEERLQAIFEQSIDTLDDFPPALGRLLSVDTRWLFEKIRRARCPDAIGDVQTEVQSPAVSSLSPFNEDDGVLDVALTDAGIRNGYFDIERRYADRLFPADSYGSKGNEQKGVELFLHHDCKKSPYESDLRVKSKALVSFRKRFSAYFTAHASKAGDVIRIKRISELSYELTYLPKTGE